MDSSRTLNINAEPAAIIRCLLNPTDLKEWWQCHAVVDARVGGVWALGWGENENGHGHAMVITGFVQEIVEGSRFSVYIEPITIVFDVVPDGNGTMMTISQFNFPEGQDADASLETWVSAMAALKSHVEPAEQSAPEPQAPPTTRENPLVGERQTGSKPTVNVRD
ncbi:SRPBCC domain-containing protein, partial [Myxococcota bacterium]|nr:SRPBCC domain-containing protein [Myxococcota bacterium]